MEIHSSCPLNQTFPVARTGKKAADYYTKASITNVECGIYKILRRRNIWKLFSERLIESLKKYNF